MTPKAPPMTDVSRDVSELLPLRYIDGPDYCTVKDASGADFALTMRPDLMKAMEAALSSPPVAAMAGERNAVIEECAAIADDYTPSKHDGTLAAHVTGSTIARAIRALATTPQPSPLPTADDLRKVDRDVISDEMLVTAMRAFEPLSSVLRYREKDKWHTCDMMAMREALRAALALLRAAPGEQAHTARDGGKP